MASQQHDSEWMGGRPDMRIGKRTGSGLVRACLEYLRLVGVMAWRSNNAGVYDQQSGKYRAFTGRRGVGDILGVLPGGKLLSVECKEGTGRLSVDQKAFMREVNDLGGLAVCVRNVDDLIRSLKGWL